jgi:hypothetical protein
MLLLEDEFHQGYVRAHLYIHYQVAGIGSNIIGLSSIMYYH